MRLDVNTDATIILTAKLEKLHRSAFPNAVRFTLNDVAFESKKLIPKKANENFTIRQKNLFSRFSKVEKAKGWDVSSMSSAIGLDATSQPKLVSGLAVQEKGGNIDGRKLTPHNMGRISGSYGKKVKSKNQFKNLDKIGTAKKRVQGSKYFRIKNGSKETVFERVSKTKIVPIYNVRQTKISRVKAQPFIHPSAVQASKQMDRLYYKNAQFQFKKHLR